MDTPDPIHAYLREFKRELRVRGMARRRILAELRAHLLDAAEGEESRGGEEGVAAQRAIVRFGLAAETACEFNCLADRRSAVLRRALVPWIVVAALSSTATATVWAFHASPPPPQRALAHPAPRERCVKRPIALSPARARDFPGASFPLVAGARAVCDVRHANARRVLGHTAPPTPRRLAPAGSRCDD
jgi:hypothetical protein